MLNAAIIGLGVGAQHARAIAELPQCRVMSLCDLDRQKLAAYGAEYPHARLTENADEVLTDPAIDFVVIASYDNVHTDQILTALDNRKHVLVEKPLCHTESELDRITEALARHPDLVFQSNLILRRSPRLVALRDAIRAGELGELYYIEADYAYGRVQKITEGWRGEIPFYSVMAGGGIHMIDMVLWLTGRKVIEVHGYANQIATRDTSFRYEDFTVALLSMDNGMVAKISANFACVHPHHHLFSLYGTKRSFVQNALGAAYIGTRDPSVPPEPDLTNPYVQKGAFIPNFVGAIEGRNPPDMSRAELLDSMRVCVAIDQSVRDRCVVRPRLSESFN